MLTFVRSMIDYKKNVLVIYYKNENNKIVKKKTPYNRIPPLTHKRKYKHYPPDSVSTSKIYNKIYNCNLTRQVQFNDEF